MKIRNHRATDMWNVVLFISFAATSLHDTSAFSLQSPLDALNTQLEIVNDLVTRVQVAYRDDVYRHPLPKEYGTTMGKTCTTLSRVSTVADQARRVHCSPERRMMEDNFSNLPAKSGDLGNSTRRPDNLDLMFQINFYKALSRALREEYKDNPDIQENIHDGLTPPTMIKG